MKRRIDDEGSRRLWREARSFGELCALGERFVRGELSIFPGWNAPDLDDESDEIAEVLARLSRSGFLTCASQPARADQRAFVAGFVASGRARDLASLAPGLDLRLFPPKLVDGNRVDQNVVAGSEPAHEGPAGSEPVSRASGRFHAFAGHDARSDELACFEGEIGSAAFVELERAIYVTAFDSEWGRRDLLWSELLRALDHE